MPRNDAGEIVAARWKLIEADADHAMGVRLIQVAHGFDGADSRRPHAGIDYADRFRTISSCPS